MEGTVQVLEELECWHLLSDIESNSCPSEYPLILLEEWQWGMVFLGLWWVWAWLDGVEIYIDWLIDICLAGAKRLGPELITAFARQLSCFFFFGNSVKKWVSSVYSTSIFVTKFGETTYRDQEKHISAASLGSLKYTINFCNQGFIIFFVTIFANIKFDSRTSSCYVF